MERETHIIQTREDLARRRASYALKYEEWLDLIETRTGHPQGLRLLDIGCGIGAFLWFAERRGFRCDGMDPYDYNVAATRENCPAADVREGTLDGTLPYEAGTFDVVSLLDVIEHMEDLDHAVQEIQRVLKPGGLVFMSTPNGNYAYRLRNVPLLGVPDRTPGHINVHPRAFWESLLARHGFREVTSLYSNHWLTHIQPMRVVNKLAVSLLGLKVGTIPLLNQWCGTALILGEKP